MNRETAQRFYLSATKALIFVALFSPLVLSGIFYFPFIVTKTLFFQIAVECALFFMVKSVFVSGRDWLMLLRVFLCASVLVSLYGIGQKLGLTWFYHANIDRIDSTIGNAAFVAGYLIFALFFALLLLVKDANMPFRIFYIFSIALNLAVIYFTGTRGAALALLAGFFVLLALYLFKRDISI